MDISGHIEAARGYFSAADSLMDARAARDAGVATRDRVRGRAIWGAAFQAINALGHRIGEDDCPPFKIATRQKRLLRACVERGLLAESDMEAYMANIIPLQSHFYGGKDIDAERFVEIHRDGRALLERIMAAAQTER